MRKWVEKTPLITTLLLESANVSQLVRMWTERSALGQSIVAWMMVNAALVLWFIYYKVMMPEQRLPRYCTAFGIAMNLSVVMTVVYFRLWA